jgi:hypothetical protein
LDSTLTIRWRSNVTNLRRGISIALAAIAMVGLNACDDDPTGTASDDQVILTSVSPAGGAANVDPGSPVVIEFDHPMAEGMEAYCVLHDGGLNGRFSLPTSRLSTHTSTWCIWAAECRMDTAIIRTSSDTGTGWEVSGSRSTCLARVEERWEVTIGSGWQHHNGMYGMTFSFTTAP